MLFLMIAPLIIAVIALAYARRQTNIAEQATALAKKLAAKQDEQEKEINAWLLKHEDVAVQLSRIYPHSQVVYPDNTTRIIYTDLFPDATLRKAIQNYIVLLDHTMTVFTPRKPTELELRSPALRETVTKVADILDALRRDNPQVVSHFAKPK
jgi:hypothetical protein